MFVYAVLVVWELFQFFLPGREYAMNIKELAERLGDCPEEVLSPHCDQKRSWQSQGIVVKPWPLHLFFIEVATETEK